MFEPLSLVVGAAVSRAVLRAWLKDASVALDVGTDLVSALERQIPGVLARRNAARQIDAIADRVAEKLEPFFDAEFSQGLEEHERLAAAEAVGATLSAGLNTRLLVTSDLEPQALERELRKRDPNRSRRVLLSEAGTRLYDIVLQECCSYIVEIATQFPDFDLRATQELLTRDRALERSAQEVLARLASMEARALAAADHRDHWEVLYRRHLARRLGQLELFGLDLSPRTKRYALETAYITLGVSTSSQDDAQSEEGATQELLRVDAALSERRRILIRGEAGGGKTTLLQWLAVMSAERRFRGPLASWNGTVPFFVQLRRVTGPMPGPEQFLDGAAPLLTGAMPEGYVHSKLVSGEALVLVDGVDELPEARREEARAWLEDLCTTYPHARLLVTSRPPAADDDWLAEAHVEACLLEPMQPVDIRSFVAQWHEAAREQETDEEAAAELTALELRLSERIDADSALQELAGVPLLCAMLCALNRDRRADLPSDRAGLYRIAVEMLLERRDVERKVPVSPDLNLGLRQKLVLLQELAYWLVLNAQVEVARDVAVRRFGRSLKSLPRVTASAEHVLQHLLERAGLIREPVPGRLGFVHRTFLEYLAALHIADEDNINFLVVHAEQDAWREITLLTAGAAQAHQREALVGGLIERGDREPATRQVLHLLAAACGDLAPALSQTLMSAVTDRLRVLVPPTTLSDANTLASAGVLAVPMLEYKRGRTGRINQACVRALGRIGGEAALLHLRPYAADGRRAVQEELRRAWTSFDAERYAKTVLAEAAEPIVELAIDDPELIRGLKHLPDLARLDVTLRGARAELNALKEAPHLRRLELLSLRTRTLHLLASHRKLTSLYLNGLPELVSLQGIGALPIEYLFIDTCPALRDISELMYTRTLRRVSLANMAIKVDLNYLNRSHQMTELWLQSLPDGTTFRGLRLKSLSNVMIMNCRIDHWDWLQYSCDLMQLSFHHCRFSARPERLPACTRDLTLDGSDITSFQGWGSPQLEKISAMMCSSLVSLEGLERAPAVEEAWLSFCPQLRDIGSLASLRSLRYLDIEGCSSLGSLDPLRRLPVEVINISNCSSQLDLSPLKDMSSLQMIFAQGLEEQVTAAGLGDILLPALPRGASLPRTSSPRPRSQRPARR